MPISPVQQAQEKTEQVAQRPQEAALRLPKLGSPAFEKVRQELTKSGLEYEAVGDKNSKQVSFFVGDFHQPEYRKELATTLEHLVKNLEVTSVGLEGVWGAPRPGILEERYELAAKVLGKDTADRMRSGEKEQYAPFDSFIKGELLSPQGEEVKVFGLEDKVTLTRSMFIYEQHEMLKDLLGEVNIAITKSRGRGEKLTSLVELFDKNENSKLLALERDLLNLNQRVADDSELSNVITEDLPRYSRDALSSIAGVTKYQQEILAAKSAVIFSDRDKAMQVAHKTYESKQGNTASSMGWIHVRKAAKASTSSSIVVHPVKSTDSNRLKYDQIIRAVFRDKQEAPFDFFQGR